MTPFSWIILSFALLMAAVCGFTYVQILRSENQAKKSSPQKSRSPSSQN